MHELFIVFKHRPEYGDTELIILGNIDIVDLLEREKLFVSQKIMDNHPAHKNRGIIAFQIIAVLILVFRELIFSENNSLRNTFQRKLNFLFGCFHIPKSILDDLGK